MTIASLCWPLERLGEGIEELARLSGLRPAARDGVALSPPPDSADSSAMEVWLDWVGETLGLDIDPVETTVPSVESLLLRAGPVVIKVPHEEGEGFALLLGSAAGKARVLAPDLSIKSCPVEALRRAICSEFEAPLMDDIDSMLDRAGINIIKRDRLRSGIAAEHLAERRVRRFWMIRMPSTADFTRQLTHEQAPLKAAAMTGAFACVYLLEILAWLVIGDVALNGRADAGWLTAWVLLILTIIPLRLAGSWIDAKLAINVGSLVKLRLLAGALQFDLEDIKRNGVGRTLGRVMECQALESLAVNGGLGALIALLELAFAFWVLSQGAAGGLHVALLFGWLFVIGCLGWRYYGNLSNWTENRLNLTHHITEQMVGHRTRLAQEWPNRRDEIEDGLIKDYQHASTSMDRSILPFLAGAQSGWMIVGLAGLIPAFVSGDGSPVRFAVSLGGIMIAARGLSGLSSGLAAGARAVIAWRQAGPIFLAGAKSHTTSPYLPASDKSSPERPPLIDADGINFAYDPASGPVLQQTRLIIENGERILLEGSSGSGKSTLASVIVGLRQPNSGLLLLNGLDRATLGDNWHRIATEAPQFHENHIFTGTLAFNLLMGRRWPASDEDLALAEEICVELGLGDLLQRMPSGLMQTIGETGWQLSHGERSRVFLARALLQDAELTILDESFASLDPETLRTCLEASFKRAQTLMVIAHP